MVERYGAKRLDAHEATAKYEPIYQDQALLRFAAVDELAEVSYGLTRSKDIAKEESK